MQSETHFSPRHIGVFKFKNIGDVILMTPALRALADNYPEAKISVAINAESTCLIEGLPFVDRVFGYQRQFKGRNVVRKVAYELRYFFRLRRQKFDLIIDFDQGDRTAWYSRLCGARERWTFWKKRPWWMKVFSFFTREMEFPPTTLHVVDWHLRLLQKAGLRIPEKPRLEVHVSPEDHAWARAQKKEWAAQRLVVVHPIARWIFKRWDPAKMAQIIDWLQQERGVTVVISNGGLQREIDKVAEITAACRTQPKLLTGGMTLGQLAALIQSADCFLGVDTGPMHIAAAVNTPLVCLFGPTHAENWAPWTDQRVLLQGHCFCGPKETLPCVWPEVRTCMQEITVEQVKEALDSFLSKPAATGAETERP